MLKIEGLTKYYKKQRGIEDFHLQLKKGNALGIIGVNGSGKTTFFKVLLNLIKADAGTIYFKNQDLRKQSPRILGYLPEDRCLYKDLTVLEHVLFLGRLKGMEDCDIETRLEYYLKFLKIPDYKYTKISKLSKGNQQKIQLICAIIHDPEIIILDEPLSGLDIVNIELFKKLIRSLKQEGKYVLFSSHQFAHIEEFCEDLIILKKGLITYEGSLENLISQNDSYHLRIENELAITYCETLTYKRMKKIGRYTEFEIEGKDSAYKQFQMIVNKENNTSVSLLESNIEKIIREKDYI